MPALASPHRSYKSLRYSGLFLVKKINLKIFVMKMFVTRDKKATRAPHPDLWTGPSVENNRISLGAVLVPTSTQRSRDLSTFISSQAVIEGMLLVGASLYW